MIVERDQEKEFLDKMIRGYQEIPLYRFVFFTSLRCNLACDYCYETHRSSTLSQKSYRDILAYLKDKHGIFGFDWFGGEPILAYKTICWFMEEFKKDHPHDKILSSMTTNGTLLTRRIFDDLIHHGVTSFQITIYGDKECHDQHRVTPTGEGTFDTILNHLIKMKDNPEKFEIIVRVNMNQETKLASFFSLFEKHFGADKRFCVFLFPLSDWGKMDEDYRGKLLTKTDFFRQANLLMAEHPNIRNYQFEELASGSVICNYGRPNIFVVNAEGLIVDCTLDYTNNPYGSVAELEKINRERSNELSCHEYECPIFPICFGDCCKNQRKNCRHSIDNYRVLLEYAILKKEKEKAKAKQL